MQLSLLYLIIIDPQSCGFSASYDSAKAIMFQTSISHTMHNSDPCHCTRLATYGGAGGREGAQTTTLCVW